MKNITLITILISFLAITSIKINASSIIVMKKKEHFKVLPQTLSENNLSKEVFESIDEFAKKTPIKNEKNIQSLADYLTQPYKTEIEKIRALFTWVATHVKYDTESFNARISQDNSAEYVFKHRIAVCEGYSNLLDSLCKAVRLESQVVEGYAKGFGYVENRKLNSANHDWNAIKVNGNWCLFDVTWGAGYCENKAGRAFYIASFEPFWFNTNPKAFIFTHLPENKSLQLINEPIEMDTYIKMPWLSEPYFLLGFNADSTYDDAIKNNYKEFVKCFVNEPLVKVIKAPNKEVIKGKEISFLFESEMVDEITLVEKNKWYTFNKNNLQFSLSYKPTAKEFEICVKIKPKDKMYATLLIYKVR